MPLPFQPSKVNGTALSEEVPLRRALIALIPEDLSHNLSLVRRDQIDSDGTFTLRAIVPGKYTVVALRNGWEMEWQNAEVLRPYMAGGTPVEVLPNKEFQVKVRVQ